MICSIGSGGLQILQSRPVTAKKQDTEEKRVWNLSLRRSFENLGQLRAKIEGKILPGMQQEAEKLAEKSLAELPDQDLAGEIGMRQRALDHWTSVYWEDLIPFAHGIRWFGQVYNDAVRPQDPFAFVTLLRPDRLESIERNRTIRQMADYIGQRPQLRDRIKEVALSECGDEELVSRLESYQQRYGNLLGIQADRAKLEEHLRTLLLEMSDPARPLLAEQTRENRETLEQEYLSAFEEEDRERASELLDLGRASYRIWDDDNIYLDRFTALLWEAEVLARSRLGSRGLEGIDNLTGKELVRALTDPEYRPRSEKRAIPATKRSEVDARQLLGQPASHGIATGRAKVVMQPEELFSLKKGEILVCDAIDPAMTFVAPLAAGIGSRSTGISVSW